MKIPVSDVVRSEAKLPYSGGAPVRLASLPDAFFFRPADPTVLGLMRICTGVLALYVHLIYSFDLQALCGKDAWLNLQTANELRLRQPVMAFPSGWQFPTAELT